jgi:hypothetical protein
MINFLENPSVLFVLKQILDRVIHPMAKPFIYTQFFHKINFCMKIKGAYYFFRPFIISDLLALFGDWESYVKDVFNPKSGDVIVDVGAYIGTCTVPNALKVGEKGMIISFEPDPENFELLLKTIKMNELKQVKAFNTALGEKKGKKRFRIDKNPMISGV